MASQQQFSRFAIIGTGGVGGYIGGVLANSGLDVTFVSRPSTAEILKSNGLILKTVDEEINLPSIKVVDCPSSLSSGVDVVLLTTKTYDLENSIVNIPSEIKEKAVFLTFQNGIDNDLRAKQALNNARVYPGIAYIVSKKSAPGRIEQSAGPRKFIIGDRDCATNEEITLLASTMHDAGLDITASPNIEKELWTKYIWILAFAGVTGACRSSIGKVVNDPSGLRMFERCVDEAITVARALMVEIGESERKMVLDKAEGYKTKGVEAKASLAIDLDEKRKTEVEALHGALVRLASDIGISVPTIETIYNTIKLSSN